MSDFRDIELETLRIAVDTLKSEIQEIITAKQKDAKLALRFYDQNRQLKAQVMQLRKAIKLCATVNENAFLDNGRSIHDYIRDVLKEVE